VVVGSIPRSVAEILSVNRLSTLAKPLGGVRSIIVDEMFYWLLDRALCFQFCDVSSSHLLPHEFGVVIRTKREG
jgi:hypothetical protein